MKRHIQIIQRLEKPSFTRIVNEREYRLEQISKKYGKTYQEDLEMVVRSDLALATAQNILTDMEVY